MIFIEVIPNKKFRIERVKNIASKSGISKPKIVIFLSKHLLTGVDLISITPQNNVHALSGRAWTKVVFSEQDLESN